MACQPRRLSDVEWAAFLNQVDVLSMNLPAWGGIVNYGGSDILVLLGPPEEGVTNYIRGTPVNFEVFLTEVTGCPIVQQVRSYGSYDPDQDSWWAHLPAELWDQTKDVVTTAYNTAPQALQDSLVKAANAAGQAISGAVGPVAGALTPLVIGLGLVAAMILLAPKR